MQGLKEIFFLWVCEIQRRGRRPSWGTLRTKLNNSTPFIIHYYLDSREYSSLYTNYLQIYGRLLFYLAHVHNGQRDTMFTYWFDYIVATVLTSWLLKNQASMMKAMEIIKRRKYCGWQDPLQNIVFHAVFNLIWPTIRLAQMTQNSLYTIVRSYF